MNNDITPEVTREEFWKFEGYRYDYLERVAIMIECGHVPEYFARAMALEITRKNYKENCNAHNGI